LGVGVGNERSGNECSITSEELDQRRHASMLDGSLEILTAAWTGEPVSHQGEQYTFCVGSPARCAMKRWRISEKASRTPDH
jgi:alkanesulfonate monooxygenase SsuD/methylene tetrahydromethanopterin reductase-like flavin-dependent oxidoreductase (luciferase family)